VRSPRNADYFVVITNSLARLKVTVIHKVAINFLAAIGDAGDPKAEFLFRIVQGLSSFNLKLIL